MKIDSIARTLQHINSYNLGLKAANEPYYIMKEMLKAYKNDDFFYHGFKEGIKTVKKIKKYPSKRMGYFENFVVIYNKILHKGDKL